MKSSFAFVFLAAAAAVGCLPDTSGVSPPDDRLIYPVGAAVTPSDDYLLVANSNFDLMYNAGTLVAVDLGKLDGLLEDVARDPENSAYLSEDHKYVFIPDSDVILADETLRVGAFASDLDLTPDGRRAIIPVRGERAILLVDLDEERGGDLMSCGAEGDKECDSAHRVESNDRFTLPIEPYEVAALQYDQVIDGVPSSTTIGFATHLAGGEVSAFVIDRDGKLAPELIGVAGDVVPGASGIAVNPVTQEIYVSGRRDPAPHVAVMKILSDSENGSLVRDPFFGEVSSISLTSDLYAGTNARGIAVNGLSDTAFLVTRSPEALLRLDTRKRRLLDMTTLGSDPSVVNLFEDDNGTPDDDSDDELYAFVLCFLSNQVYVVEPDMMQVNVRSTGSGPHAVAFDKKRKRAYVVNFRESTISLIDATPPFDHVGFLVTDPQDSEKTIKASVKIGKPRLPEGHS